MTPQDLLAGFGSLIETGREQRLLIVSRSRPAKAPDQLFNARCSIEWLRNVQTAQDVQGVAMADLCLLFNQLEHMAKTEGVHLLSRLRDHHCRRMLMHCASQEHTSRELFALGFIQQQRPSLDGRLFVFDPDIYFERRNWNTPQKWAHPENFNKYRW